MIFFCSKITFTMSHVVDAIQVGLSLLIIHVLAFGSDDLDGVMAEEDLTRRPIEEQKSTPL